VLVIAGVFVVTFFISHIIPSDPARLYAGGERATPEEVNQARIELGLDRSIPSQFLIYVSNAVHGNFGTSIISHRAVTSELAVVLPASLELVIPAMTLAILIGLPLGVLAGANQTGWWNRVARLGAIAGAALPSFWVGLVGQLIFAVWLGLLPVAGQVGIDTTINNPIPHITGFNLIDAAITGNWNGWLDSFGHLVLPVLVLSIFPTSLVIRQSSSSVRRIMNSTYVIAARAAGLPESMVLFRFVLKNAIGPTLTVIGLTFAGSITGVVLIETIFSWPGLGSYVTTSIESSDYPVIMTVTVLGAVAYVAVNLIVDLLQAALDPRVRLN
jgi:peptide/nickel transport system permease protein